MVIVLVIVIVNSPYGLCGRKATSNERATELRICVKAEMDVSLLCSSFVVQFVLCGPK